MGGNYLGAALLGLGQGIQQGEQDVAQQNYVAAQRPLLLQAQQIQNQQGILTLQEEKTDMDVEAYSASIMMKAGLSTDGSNPGTQPAAATPPAIQPPPPAATPPGGAAPQQGSPAPNQPPPDQISVLKAQNMQATKALATATDPAMKDSLQKQIATNTATIGRLQTGMGPASQLAANPVNTPQANVVQAKEDTGAPVTPAEHKTAADSLEDQAAKFTKMANAAAADPSVSPVVRQRTMQLFQTKALEAAEKATEYRTKQIDQTDKEVKEVNEAVGSFNPQTATQAEYAAMMASPAVQGNKAYQAQAKALGLTGDIEQDRDKLAGWQRRTLSYKDKKELANKEAQLQLDRDQKTIERQRLGMEGARLGLEAEAEHDRHAKSMEEQKDGNAKSQMAGNIRQRLITSADEAAADLENLSRLPADADSGGVGSLGQGKTLMTAGRNVLSNEISAPDTRRYNTESAGIMRNLSVIEANGVNVNQSLVDSLTKTLTINPGDTHLDKLRKNAQARQILVEGLETNKATPGMTKEQLAKIDEVVSKVQKAIPYSVKDVDELADSGNKKVTLQDVMDKQKGSSATPAAPQPYKDSGKEERYQQWLKDHPQ